MSRLPDYRNPNYEPGGARNPTIGWWGIGSLASGAIALAFLPAALMSKAWVAQISAATPLWAICCLIGIGTGIRGMQGQRRATKIQRRTAFLGTLLSLLTFVTLTIITVFVSA